MPKTLRELRAACGITLSVLHDLSGVSVATLSQIERGRAVASAREADLIGKALGLPDGALVTRSFLIYEEAA